MRSTDVIGPVLLGLRLRRATQPLESLDEDLKAARPIVSRQELSHASRSPSLLELWNHASNGCRRIDDLVRIPKSPFAQFTLNTSACIWKSEGERCGFTDVPRFQFSAHHSDEYVTPPGALTEFDEPGLDFVTVSAVLISHDDETHSRFPPSAELSRDAPRQILLALVRETLKPKLREEARQQLEQIRHVRLFHQEDELRHYGLAPSNNFCLHNSLGRSPSATRRRNSSLSLARRTVENPSAFTSQ